MSGATLGVNEISARQVLPQGNVATGKENDAIANFFGPPIQKVVPNQYYNKKETHWTLPEAYKGESLFLKDTVEGLMYDNSPWTTSRALPWWYSEQLNVKRNIWRLEQGMLPIEPHEGMPRLLEASKTSWQDSQVRYGIAVKFEGDFYKTSEGQEQYARYMIGIQKFVQERANADVLRSLLQSNTEKGRLTLMYGESQLSYTQLFDDDVRQVAALHDANTGYNSLQILVAKHRKAMLLGQFRVIPDLLITPAGLSIFMATAHEKTLEYWAWSNDGALLLKNCGRAWTFDDEIDIVEAPDYGVHQGRMPIQQLKRRKIIGQHIPMYAWFRNMEDITGFTNEWRNTYILDMTAEKWKKITFQDAFMNAALFDHPHMGGGYNNELKKYVERASAANIWNPYSKELQSQYAMMKNGIPQTFVEKSKAPFFLASDKNGNGEYDLITHFGQMEKSAATMRDFIHMAQTAIYAFCGRGGREFLSSKEMSYQDAILKFYNIVHDIEMVSSDKFETYFSSLASKIGDSMKDNITEVYQVHDIELEDITKPAIGFNNGSGLRALAKQGHPDAKIVVDFFDRLSQFLSTTFKTCEMNDPENAEPWFKKGDSISVLYSLLGMDRTPLFLNIGTEGVNNFNAGGVVIASDNELNFVIDAADQLHQERLKSFVKIFSETTLKTMDESLIDKVILLLLKEYTEAKDKDEPTAKSLLHNTIDDLFFGTLASLKRPIPASKEKQTSKDKQDLDKRKMDGKAFIEKSRMMYPQLTRAKPDKTDPTYEGKENWVLTSLTSSPSLVQALQKELGENSLKLWKIVRPADPEMGFKQPLNPIYADKTIRTLGQFENIATMSDLLKNPNLKNSKTLKITQNMQRQIRGLNLKQQSSSSHFGKSQDPFRTSVSNRHDEDEEMTLLLSGSKKFSKIGAHVSQSRTQTTTPFIFPTEQYSRVGDADIDRPGFSDNWYESNAITNSLVRLFVQCIMTTRCDNIQCWLDLMENHIHVPINILLWRPAIKFELQTLILMKSGIETGATLHGHSNFALGSDVFTKTWHAHYTTYMKAMTWKPENVHLIEDVGCSGYEDGMDANFMADPRKELFHVLEHNQMSDRGSIIATAVPLTEGEPFTNMSISGKLKVPSFNPRFDKPLVNTYSTSEYYVKLWALEKFVSAAHIEVMTYQKKADHFSGNTREGRYWTYDPKSQTYSVDHKGNNHLKTGECPEACQVWKGSGAVFPKQPYQPILV